jgi:hypothetical protein
MVVLRPFLGVIEGPPFLGAIMRLRGLFRMLEDTRKRVPVATCVQVPL